MSVDRKLNFHPYITYFSGFADIDENDLLSPLLVIHTLSNNESTTLDLLKVDMFNCNKLKFNDFILFK